ncbi:RNA polymerase sigma factor [Micromonospora aurantiaca (nom. illeg.)]|uniref:RNA polymerase sigma factor n=1 Tax=Micromonospora aurantiaca (nom. illeg.) TaxID=47850 RepID=UPI0033FD480F
MASDDTGPHRVVAEPVRWHGRIEDLGLAPEQRDLFVLLFGTYWQPLVRFAGSQASRRRMSSIDVDVEAIVQEAFIDLLGTDELIENTAGWLFSTTSRKVAKEHVKLVRRKKLMAAASGIGAPGMPWLYGDDGSDRLTVHDVLAQTALLPDKQRVAAYLKLILDWDDEEIATYLGCAHATARVHVHRARHRLGKALAADYGTFHSSVTVIDDAGAEYVVDPQDAAALEHPSGGDEFHGHGRPGLVVIIQLLVVLLVLVPCMYVGDDFFDALPQPIQTLLAVVVGIVAALQGISIVGVMIYYFVDRWNRHF